MEDTIYEKPYTPVSNNRKKTKCRIRDDKRHGIQSVPVFDRPKDMPGRKQLGYKYINHNK